MAMTFPEIDPVAIHLGAGIGIRWYALAYIAGLIGGWRYMRWLAAQPPHPLTAQDLDDFLLWATLGVVGGGRLGYILFYKPGYYLANPLDMLKVWEGGMSFHGGALGVIAALFLFCRSRRLNVLAVGDVLCAVVPLGLFFGRIANFINGELFGRIAAGDVPWAMIFPRGGPVPRHPSQIYEALLEGFLLLVVLHILWRRNEIRQRPGLLAGLFLAGYGLARFVCEIFREPDSFLGFLWWGATMGQLLSIPLIVAGGGLAVWAARRTRA